MTLKSDQVNSAVAVAAFIDILKTELCCSDHTVIIFPSFIEITGI